MIRPPESAAEREPALPSPVADVARLDPSTPRRLHARHGPVHRIVALAAQVLEVADATLALIDGEQQGVLASTGPPGSDRHPLADQLSEVVAATGSPLVVPDLASSDHRGPDGQEAAGAFLGVPLLSRGTHPVGVLYLTDRVPRAFGDHELQLLVDFAAVIADHLELTRRAEELDPPADQSLAVLARAITRGEIIPWYQPIVDLVTGRIVAVEALARWEHPGGDLDGPDSFIPLAERSNLIVDLDRIVIRQALQDLSRWHVRHPGLRLSVNLSGRHLDLDDWVPVIQELVRSSGVAPTAVSLELTETVRPSAELRVNSITELREAGFQIWFDDFGSGWATLQELLTFPLDGLKIDRSFAVDLGQHTDDTIVRAITTTGQELGLRVTMEGIETTDQAAIATRLGCHYGQGYLWSRALPAEQLEALITTPDGLLPRLP